MDGGSGEVAPDPSEVVFDAPFDYGTVIAGNDYDHTIKYHIEGDQGVSPVTIKSIKLSCSEATMNLDHDNLRFHGTVFSEAISPDKVKFQNKRYKKFQGDTSDEVPMTGLNKIISEGYEDTVLYVFEATVGNPTEKTLTITATIEYDVVIPPDPMAVGGAEEIESRTVSQGYTIEFMKNFNSLASELKSMVNITLKNQDKLDAMIADGSGDHL